MTAPFGLSDDNSRTFTAGEALAQHAAVTLKSDGNVENADSDTDKVLGFASRAAASGEAVSVRLVSAPTNNCVATSAVAVGELVSPTSTAGKVESNGTPGTNPVLGVALTAAAADGDVLVIASVSSI